MDKQTRIFRSIIQNTIKVNMNLQGKIEDTILGLVRDPGMAATIALNALGYVISELIARYIVRGKPDQKLVDEIYPAVQGFFSDLIAKHLPGETVVNFTLPPPEDPDGDDPEKS